MGWRENSRMMPSFLVNSVDNLILAATRVKNREEQVGEEWGNEPSLEDGELEVLVEHPEG